MIYKERVIVYSLRIPIRGFCLELDDTLRAPVADFDRATDDDDDDEDPFKLDGVIAGDAEAEAGVEEDADADVDGARTDDGKRVLLAGLIV